MTTHNMNPSLWKFSLYNFQNWWEDKIINCLNAIISTQERLHQNTYLSSNIWSSPFYLYSVRHHMHVSIIWQRYEWVYIRSFPWHTFWVRQEWGKKPEKQTLWYWCEDTNERHQSKHNGNHHHYFLNISMVGTMAPGHLCFAHDKNSYLLLTLRNL